MTKDSRPRVAVIGAGAFGGWTALRMQEKGADVVLVDGWGPGNSRSSSGGETRVFRHSYDSRHNVDLACRSLPMWHDYCQRWGLQLFRKTGVLFATQGGEFLDLARVHLEEAGVEHEILNAREMTTRLPQMNGEGLLWGIFEPQAGYLLARRACEAVVEAFIRGGGEFRRQTIGHGAIDRATLDTLSGEKRLHADVYVFACGPWLPQLFPDLLGGLVRPTRQEVFYFGTPPDTNYLEDDVMPVWADLGEQFWYGIPGNEGRGFKVANDTHGAAIDPTACDRVPTEAALDAARNYLAHRFPTMVDAPLLEARVCQYSNTPDGQFILDRHPAMDDVWLLGGGSGHGFKHGPALGDLAASCVLDNLTSEPLFRLDRFSADARAD
ncbi:MAG: FAD-dependent oxidoreductase [Gammaproteobacteria bacterium]